jgi:gluconate 2-dehydrogenase subunit 3-like protein
MLGSRERRILEAVCDALIPEPLESVAPPASELGRFVEQFVDELPPASVLGFRAGLWALAGAARLRAGRAIDRQDRPARAALLSSLESSSLAPLRLSLRVVCGLGLMALYSAPAVRQKLELPP